MAYPYPLVWPAEALAPRAIDPAPDYGVLFGPRSGKGIRQAASSDAGRWRLTLFDIPIFTDAVRPDRDRVMLMRALGGLLEGGLGTALMPFFDQAFRGPAKRAGAPVAAIATTHSDDTTFSDDSRYRQPRVRAALSATVALRATEFQIDMDSHEALEAGQYFGLGGNRVHLVKTSRPTSVPHRYDVTVWPPLRAAYASNAAVEFDDPRCLMAFAGDSWPSIPLQQGWRGSVTLEFEEV